MTIEPGGCPLPAFISTDAVLHAALNEIKALVATGLRPGISFALSVLDSTTGSVGLFTGRVEYDAEHRCLAPELAYAVPSEGEALAQCWRAASVSSAARVSGLLIQFGPPGLDVQIVEIKAEGA